MTDVLPFWGIFREEFSALRLELSMLNFLEKSETDSEYRTSGMIIKWRETTSSKSEYNEEGNKHGLRKN